MAGERQTVREAAQRAGVDPRILWGVYGSESNFGRDLSTSPAGAEGPFQFEPATARSLGVNPHDFRSAAFGAARYLAQFKGRGLAGMLSAYNAGPAGGLQPDYVRKVEANARSYGAETGGSPGQLGVQQTGPDPALIAQLEALLKPSAPSPPALSMLPTPAHSAGPILPRGAQQVAPLQPPAEASASDKITPLLEQLLSSRSSSVTGPEQALTNAVPRGTKLNGFLPGDAELQVKHTDQGQDVQTNPGGPILAPGNGYVKLVQSNPGGFGANYPIVHFTSGPLAGHDVYIGHTHSALPQGAHFQAGQVLSHTGHGTAAEGNARTPGWAEIGLWGASGPGNREAGKQIAPLLGLR